MPSGRRCLTDYVLHLNTTAALSLNQFTFRFWELRVQKRTSSTDFSLFALPRIQTKVCATSVIHDPAVS